MNLETVTLQDCIERYEKNGEATIINDGKVVGFMKENIPAPEHHEPGQG